MLRLRSVRTHLASALVCVCVVFFVFFHFTSNASNIAFVSALFFFLFVVCLFTCLSINYHWVFQPHYCAKPIMRCNFEQTTLFDDVLFDRNPHGHCSFSLNLTIGFVLCSGFENRTVFLRKFIARTNGMQSKFDWKKKKEFIFTFSNWNDLFQMKQQSNLLELSRIQNKTNKKPKLKLKIETFKCISFSFDLLRICSYSTASILNAIFFCHYKLFH